MTRHVMVQRAIGLMVLVPTVMSCSGEPSAPAPKPAAAATVAQARPETELTTITLSPEAVQRVGIHTTTAATRPLSATRTLGGEVIVPDGQAVTVSAPVAGTLAAANSVQPGIRVAKGTAVFRLQPIASADRDQRIEAERLVATAQAESDAVSQRLQRLERLLADGAASQRMVEEARAQQATATAALTAARERLVGVSRNGMTASGELVLAAPLTGILQAVSVSVGQTVAAGAPLFTVANVDVVWVRVPVYAGDVATVDLNQSVAVKSLGVSAAPRVARRVESPPKADPTAASVDVVYELPAGTPSLTPGERVTVEVPLKSSATGLAIPDSALVYDIHGDTWVYQDRGNNVFSRVRVLVTRHVGNQAVISKGLAEGARIVDVGAAELFGTEFGTGK